MKNVFFGLLVIGSIAACSTSSTSERTADTENTSSVQSSGGGNVLRYETQFWDNGLHFCTYTAGFNKIIKQIETFEKCPSEITE